MGASVDYLIKDPKTGRLSFRRVYPAELRPHVPGQSRELKKSFGATSITAPGTRESFNAAAAEYEANVAMAQKALAGTFDTLDTARVEWLARTYVHSRLVQDEAARFARKILGLNCLGSQAFGGRRSASWMGQRGARKPSLACL